LSRDRQCALMLLSLLCFTIWNKKQSSKRSMILCSRLNSLLRGLNDRAILLYLFLISTMWPLIFCHCLGLRCISKRGWGVVKDGKLSNNDLIIWFVGKEWALSWDLSQSFQRWNLTGIMPVIASIPNDRDMWKAPEIYITTWYCILPSSLMEYEREALL